MSVTYRAPVPSDAGGLSSLACQTFAETFGHMTGADDMALFLAEHRSAEAVGKDIVDPDIRLHIAEAGGEMIGYCKVGLTCDFKDWPPQGRKQVTLKELYVRSSHQGKGVAQSLMNWALEVALEAKADEMVLSVWSGNQRAEAFYRKYGFGWVADTIFMTGNQRDEEFLYARSMAS